VENILKLAKKVAEQAEVFHVSLRETPVGFEANRLKTLETGEATSVSLRIIKNGRIGFATTTGVDRPQELVDMAVETSQFGATAKFELPPAQQYTQVKVYDPSVNAVAIDSMVDMGNSLIARVLDHTPELVCDAEVAMSEVAVNIMNSRGGQASYRKSYFSIGIEGTLIRDTDMLFVHDSDSSCHPIAGIDHIADSVIQQLELARETATVSTGKMPVILTPKGVRSALFTPLALAFNGKMVMEGASPLVGKLGQGIFDTRLSVWDDSTIDFRPASRPCDDEGVPSRRTRLIDNGVVASFLYDLQTAAATGSSSTGNGNRARGGLPTPSISAIVIDEGETTFDEMLRDMQQGLVVEMLIGAEQGNVLGGEFSGNVLLGYRVENGHMVGRVKNTMVSGNIYESLKQVAAIGSAAEWVGGAIKTPAIYLSSLSVASKV